MAKKNSSKVALVIAIIIIIALLVLIWNMRKQYSVQENQTDAEDIGVSYIDLTELEEGADTPAADIAGEETTPVVTPKAEPVAAKPAVEENNIPAPLKQSAVQDKNELNAIIVKEGDLVSFPNLKAEDADGDKITFTFSKPLDSKGEWQTSEGDAGTYEVTITASDGKESTSEKVMIIVETSNRAPVIQISDSLTFDEGATIKLTPKMTDADGDKVTVSYSGFMQSDTKVLSYNDQGTHEVTITATDSKATTAKKVTIIVNNVNRKPQIVNII